MTAAQVRISAEEQKLLRALSMGQSVALPSAHRLRLEMLGLLQDGPRGAKLTPLGRRYAESAIDSEDEGRTKSGPGQDQQVKRDRLGRRMPHGRSLPF